MIYTKTVWEDSPSTNTPITASALNNIENGIEYLFEKENDNINDLRGKILWRNPDSDLTNSFSAQTITLSENSENYDMYEIIFKIGNGSSDPFVATGAIPIGSGHYSDCIGDNLYYRDWTISGDQLSMSNASRITTYGQNPTTNNNGLLPVYIIFYKTGLFS